MKTNSNYSFDQINTDKYKLKSQEILGKASNEQMKRNILQILQEGKLETDTYDFSVNFSMQMKDNPDKEGERRLFWANLLALDENNFETIAKQGATFVHGTNSIAIPGILRNGMQSEAEMKRQGLTVETGEANTPSNHITRDFISFTYDIDLAMYYSMLRPEVAKSEETFSTLIGISPDELEELTVSSILSGMPEIGIVGKLPIQYIKFIGVPESKVSEVQSLASQCGAEQIQIIPLEKIYESASITSNLTNRSSDDLIIKPQAFDKENLQDLTLTKKENNIRRIKSFVEKIFRGKDSKNKNDSYYEK